MISHSDKAIFVHIPRTAGQTIEHTFLTHLGLDQRMRPALLLREKLDGEQGPPRLSHLTAAQYQEYGYVTADEFSTYFKFSFVRNPWQRVYSFYRYLNYATKHSFNEFVIEFVNQSKLPNLDWFIAPQSNYLCDMQGNLLVDFVGRFENLQEDFNRVCEILELEKRELPVTNQSKAGIAKDGSLIDLSKIPYQDHYDSETIEIVNRLYHRDITMFGYSF